MLSCVPHGEYNPVLSAPRNKSLQLPDVPEGVAVELDLPRLDFVVPVLLHVQALVGVVVVVVLAVDGESVEAVVGVLHLHDVSVVVQALVPLKYRVVGLSFDGDVRVRGPGMNARMTKNGLGLREAWI